ncbi:hypothetical protein AB0M47_21300 [Hamadaea sp. NPDC051192]|uniref:hypothetical protein n=1 Tax=Hamadaea sp. NPDC051192 TaxID=3154940 RepID=UPI0034438EE2
MRRLILRVTVAAAVSLAAVSLAACGKSDEGSGIATAGNGGATPTASATASAADMMKFTQCMRDNGVPVGDPDPSTGRPDFGKDLAGTPQFQAALKKCQDLLPGGVMGMLDANQVEQLRVFAQCMRDHGVDMPDPDPNGGFSGAMGKIDRNSPTVKKAVEACQDKLTAVFPSLGARS